MTARLKRRERLMPNGEPRYIRCYDDGGRCCDRYTVVYTKRLKKDGCVSFVGMSEHPFHPQGFGQHGDSRTMIDRPRYSHLGKRITFRQLPEDCRKLVLLDYIALWNL